MLATQAVRADDKPVSYFHDIRPLFASQCNACHKPDKMKAELDMTTYAMLMKGGKHGAELVAGNPDKSRLIEMITGPDPDMPKDADPLKAEQIEMVTRWVKQGAKDDTPAPGTIHVEPPVYTAPPIISAMSFSPDGTMLAVSGYHEVLLHKSDGSELIARLTGEAPRIESIVFSKDGHMLGACGGAPAEFGQVQIWDPISHKNLKTFQPSTDSLYGLSFSPDGKSVACGAADKIVRRINIDDGKVTMEFKAHSDWALVTAFTLDGKSLVSGSRDKALKLIEVETGRFVDDINNPLETVMSLARHPTQDQVLYGGDLGGARIYKISDNQGRTAGRNDTNLLMTFEPQPGPVSAVAFSPDGSHVALGSIGEVRVYDAKGKSQGPKRIDYDAAMDPKQNVPVGTHAKESKAMLILSGSQGSIFAVAYKPDGSLIATGGFDGIVRLYDAKSGSLIKQFTPVPISPETKPETRPSTALK